MLAGGERGGRGGGELLAAEARGLPTASVMIIIITIVVI